MGCGGDETLESGEIPSANAVSNARA